MQPTLEQKYRVLILFVVILLAATLLLAGLLGFQLQQGLVAQVTQTPSPEFVVEQTTPSPLATRVAYNASTNPVVVKIANIDAFTGWNGSGLKLYSDAGRTLKISANAATGALVAQSATISNALTVSGTTTLASLNVATMTITNALTLVAFTAPTMTITNALTLGGQSFTGAVRFGEVASQATGAAVTHGFSITPTGCMATMVSPAGSLITATVGTITQTSFIAYVGATGKMMWTCGR